MKRTYDIHSGWNWILKDQSRLEYLDDNEGGLFDIGYMNQEETVHRRRWNYVYDHLKRYHNKHSDLQLDLYVDRTFHWDCEALKQAKVIPYTRPWIGFIHHPFDTNFSSYNSTRLIANQDFIQSLKYCKSLFVLSNYLRDQLLEAFIQHRIHDVPIHALVHPIETNVLQFSYSRWLNNPEPQMIHIGGWMRNVLRFYQLEIPKTVKMSTCKWWSSKEQSIQKCILKSIHQSRYIPSDDFQTQLHSFLFNLDQVGKEIHSIQNKWYLQLYKQISDWLVSVRLIEQASTETFDKLLSQNIVFIYVIDASVINTLLECIARNTPIIINNHPAVTELLGADYPLYIQDKCTVAEMNHRIHMLLSNPKTILKAHRYLCKLDKKKYHINTFIQQFVNLCRTLKG